MRSLPPLLAAIVLTACAPSGSETSAAAVRARVLRVVDGDTLKVRIGAERETVRLLGIDAPESVKPDSPAQCGGRAAARALRRLALTPDGGGRSVRLIADPSQAHRDRFDRLLAYVELTNGRDLGLEQLLAGWARVYVYGGVRFRRIDAYRAAERSARRARRGMWGRCGA